jgi:hypothetical protein
LRVVTRVEQSRYVTGLPRTRSRERRHDDAISQLVRSELKRLEEVLSAGLGCDSSVPFRARGRSH